MNRNQKKAFTMIELLVVVSIIGLLSTLTIISLKNSLEKARDARRYSNISIIKKTLDLYYDDHGQYLEEVAVLFNTEMREEEDSFLNIKKVLAAPEDPEFEYSYNDVFLKDLVAQGYIDAIPLDPVNNKKEEMYYFYRRYTDNEHGCGKSLGPGYILGVTNLESFSSTSRPNPNNSVPQCGIYKFFEEQYDYIIGGFE
jgi:prepilin-type N-terminal cleavage/methylation domain-containing protein